MAKPLRWRAGSRDFEGTEWAVKNLFELKNARRVLVDGNLFEYNWPHAQNGFAILFTVRNQDGGAPWSVVEDVTFANNVVRHVAAGINVLGRDDIHPSQPTRAHRDPQQSVSRCRRHSGAAAACFSCSTARATSRIDHNTALQTDTLLFGGDHAPHTRLRLPEQHRASQSLRHHRLGNGDRPAHARSLFSRRARPPQRDRRRPTPSSYPPDNFFPASVEQVGFVAPQDGNYRLAASSAYQARRHRRPRSRCRSRRHRQVRRRSWNQDPLIRR